jgi:hypothetical protein
MGRANCFGIPDMIAGLTVKQGPDDLFYVEKPDGSGERLAEAVTCDELADIITENVQAAAPDLLAAFNACRAHIALMTNQMQQFVEPSGYTAFDRKRIAFEHDREAKESLFMGDMIYLLDGPEQRELSAKCDAALAKIGGAS